MKITLMASAAMVALLCSFGGASASDTPATMHHARSDDGYVQYAGLFGESDEEKAARLAREKREDDQDAAIADLKQRVSDLESSLQQFTAQNELLTHRIQEMKAATDKMQKDWNYKLCSMSAQLMGVGISTDNGGLSCDGSNTGAAMGDTGGIVVPAAHKDYDAAMKLLAKSQYDEALAAFNSFIDANPKDDLAPQALYWVGNISYLKKDYAGAATAFAAGIKKYPKSPRVPDNMLKLGETLIALGQQKEGCLTLAAIKNKTLKAPANILAQATQLRAKSCK
ncbi:MAG: tol-pal system protein YbgF [Rhizomicrobium sp.]